MWPSPDLHSCKDGPNMFCLVMSKLIESMSKRGFYQCENFVSVLQMSVFGS